MGFTVKDYSVEYSDVNNEVKAYVTFPEFAPGIVEIDHTFVDDSLKGQGIGGKLLDKAYLNIKERGLKVILTCTYAKYYFREKHPEYMDIVKF